jgi:hypothetical protein
MQRAPAVARKVAIVVLVVTIVAAVVALRWPSLVKLFAHGESRDLRPPEAQGGGPRKGAMPILFLAFDGVDRALLYDQLRDGQLPNLAALLGGLRARELPHAHLDERLLATLPSTTMAAWATVMTGTPPAEHGVPGNEFFIREKTKFVAPAGVTVGDREPLFRVYTDDYANALLERPTVWERMRKEDPGVVVWSSMLQYYVGADRLLTARRTVLAGAVEALLAAATDGYEAKRKVYAELDEEAIDTAVEAIRREGRVPDVLSIYMAGIDLYAHHAPEGPDEARRAYLREVIDPALGALRDELDERGALADRWVVVTSDHGHTEVLHDETHALGTDGPDEPPAVLSAAGFTVRPFELETSAPFSSVLAYQGAIAFVYLADRSTCDPGCDWSRLPRFREDVLDAADAFFLASRDGRHAPGMKDTLDLVLARRPKPYAEVDAPFEVYVGGGELVPIAKYLRDHPRPGYVRFEERLRDLAVGPHGERAGDVLLLARNGDRRRVEERYYFAPRNRSWHGSPGHKDSEVPLAVGHAGRSTVEIERLVSRVVGDGTRQQAVTDLLLQLRSR